MDLKRYEICLSRLPEGMKAAEVYAEESQSFSVGLLDGAIDSYEVSGAAGISLRADCGHMGYAYTESMEDDPERLLRLAAESAAVIESEDEQEVYAGAEEYPEAPAVDPALLSATAEEKIALARELEKKALAADPRIRKLIHCKLGTTIGEKNIVNSRGLSLKQSSGSCFAYVSPMAEIDGQIKDGFAWRIARSLGELDIDGLVKEATEDLFSQFGASPVPSGTYPIVMKNSAAADLLEAFSGMFSADAAQKGLSLLAGREGEVIGNERVTLIDDPMCPMAPGQSAFDDEGVPAEKTVVAEKGVLRTLLHNLKTAKKAGCATTGNAGKPSAASPVGVSPSNFYQKPGGKSFDELLAGMGDGLLIANISGLHAGCNAVSGAFSLLARGFVVEGGRIGRPVEQITVTGNFLEYLRDVCAVGSDLRFGMSGVGSPSLFISGLQVAGK